MTTSLVIASEAATLDEAAPLSVEPESLYLRLDGTAAARKRVLIYLDRSTPLGNDAELVSSIVRLYKAAPWPAGAINVTVEGLAADFDPATTNWSTQPGVIGAPITVVVAGGGLEGDEIPIDVSPILAASVHLDDDAAQRWYGIRVSITSAGERLIYSPLHEDWAPTISVEYSELPDAPSDLVPSGDRATGSAEPVLMAGSPGIDIDDVLSALQVQIADVDDFSVLLYDTGKIAASAALLDTSANLLTPNQSTLETNTAGWTAAFNTLARDVTVAYQGAASLKSTSLGGGGNVQALTTTGVGGIPVTVGASYLAQARFRPGATARNVRVDIRWFTAAGANIGADSVGAQVLEVAGQWITAYVIGVAPATAAFASVILNFLGTAGAEVHNADAIGLKVDTILSPWQPAMDALAAGVRHYWRMKVWNGHDRDSAYSEAASFFVTAKGVLTLTAPAATPVDSPAPAFTHAFTGAQDQVEIEVQVLDEAVWRTWWILPRHSCADTTHIVPDAYAMEVGPSYRVFIRVWDVADREDLPGDREFVELVFNFTIGEAA
jgi:hypothetical protein